jgi:hypothetical protein
MARRGVLRGAFLKSARESSKSVVPPPPYPPGRISSEFGLESCRCERFDFNDLRGTS